MPPRGGAARGAGELPITVGSASSWTQHLERQGLSLADASVDWANAVPATGRSFPLHRPRTPPLSEDERALRELQQMNARATFIYTHPIPEEAPLPQPRPRPRTRPQPVGGRVAAGMASRPEPAPVPGLQEVLSTAGEQARREARRRHNGLSGKRAPSQLAPQCPQVGPGAVLAAASAAPAAAAAAPGRKPPAENAAAPAGAAAGSPPRPAARGSAGARPRSCPDCGCSLNGVLPFCPSTGLRHSVGSPPRRRTPPPRSPPPRPRVPAPAAAAPAGAAAQAGLLAELAAAQLAAEEDELLTLFEPQHAPAPQAPPAAARRPDTPPEAPRPAPSAAPSQPAAAAPAPPPPEPSASPRAPARAPAEAPAPAGVRTDARRRSAAAPFATYNDAGGAAQAAAGGRRRGAAAASAAGQDGAAPAEGDGWEISDFSYENLLELGTMAVSTGLSKQQLASFHPQPYRKPEDVEQEECTICLEVLSAGDPTLRIACQHAFHHRCVIEWLGKTNRCPTCRFEIPRKERLRA